MPELRACRVDVTRVHREPDGSSEQVTQLLRGEPVTIVRRRGGWVEIRTAYDYPGWMRASDLGGEPDKAWPTRRSDADPVDAARAYLGVPYLWGGMSERGIDCSGLVHMAHRRVGRLVPRDADQQEEARFAVEEPRTGYLLTYGDPSGADRATHIAFWLGKGRILHATDRDGVHAVVDEPEPEELAARRRRMFRL